MRTCLAVITFTAFALSAGCGMYFGDDDDDVCNGLDYGGIASSYLDPNTGTCASSGVDCDGSCQCPPETAGPISPPGGQAEADYASCYSNCTGLTEDKCEASAGCYAAYQDDPAADGKLDYTDCRQTAPSGPVQGTCQGLTAPECSRHDDCRLLYAGMKFEACQQEPEVGMCQGSDCAPGYHCEEECTEPYDSGAMTGCQAVCIPDNSSCAAVDCGPGYACVQTCEDSADGSQFCDTQCVPTNKDPGSCTGPVSCDATAPACPSGTTPGILDNCWSGYCIPNAACGPSNPGDCTGTVTCTTPSPVCPSGTTAGISNGCYTGYCIPDSACPPPTCESLTSESACSSRSDCTTIYMGSNCTCTANGCTCQNETFERCETAGMF